ncbi:MAG: DJ-1/PfpI family protein [Bacteroidales bacterium]|nr:DJ-1/PfpI family protein [Bacteroidales bacterium]
MKKVFVLLAPGFELLEATAPIDVLERCGVEVEKVSLDKDLLVPSSHSVFLKADSFLSDEKDVYRIVSQGDMVILPGGYPGYRNLAENSLVGTILKEYEKAGKFIAAICGAPSALAGFSIMAGKKATCHTSVRDTTAKIYELSSGKTERDGLLVTGRGAGVCLEFAFECAKALVGEEIIAEVKTKMEIR